MDLFTKRYKWMITVVTIGVITLALAKITNTIIGPFLVKETATALSESSQPSEFSESEKREMYFARDVKPTRSKENYTIIVSRNMFDATDTLGGILRAREEAKNEERKMAKGDVFVRSNMDAKLTGTIVASNPALSLAIINYKGNIDYFGISDTIEGAHVIAIKRNRVELDNNGQFEYIETPNDKNTQSGDGTVASTDAGNVSAPSGGAETGVISKGNNEFDVSRERLDATLANMGSIVNQARAIPYIVNGVTQGFRIIAIRPDSIYKELGIRNGDIIERVNGQEMNNIESALGLFQTLRSESNFSIDLKRRGKKETFSYTIK